MFGSFLSQRALIAGTAVWLLSGSMVSAMTLSSPDVASGATIDERFTANAFGCTGGNLSPALVWSNAPAETKSFTLSVYDPDAPTGSGWWHWTLYDLPATIHSLPQGAGSRPNGLPAGAMAGRTDAGDHAYLGPCPPVGDKPHRYIFTLRALNVEHLAVPRDASGAMVGFAAHAHTIAETSFTAFFHR